MNILLIGGSGFIGRSFLPFIANHKITIVSREIHKKPKGLKNYDFITFNDCLDEKFINQQEVIFYLRSPFFPRCTQIVKNQILMEEELSNLTSFLELNVKSDNKFIYFSSGGAIYGADQNHNFNENSPCNPISIYGVLKKQSEEIIEGIYTKNNSKNYLIVRPSNLYGPLQENISQGVVMNFLRKIYSGKEISVFGKGDGKKDYMFIDDLIFSVLELIKIKASGIFNLGSSHRYSVLEIIEILEKELNVAAIINFNESFKNDVLDFSLDLTKLSKVVDMNQMKTLEQSIKYLI